MDWKALETACDRAVSAAFAETVRHAPMKNGTADPARPAADIMAILHSPSVDGSISLGNGMITTVSASAHALVINRSAYPSIVLRSKDKVRATTRPGSPWYEVSKISDRHSGIILVELTEA
ncbi:hypothetical protein P9A16_10860 [Shinella sp. 838]|uniref:hypothetical protein n=1 Tax=Shinella sp. 838 TaxID=3038164 RepID=UPI002414EC88|nr:hypothetical protein [Shinella sp. 838]MDG4671629.1 hypothetical protein [Shinella sp. 838]